MLGDRFFSVEENLLVDCNLGEGWIEIRSKIMYFNRVRGMPLHHD